MRKQGPDVGQWNASIPIGQLMPAVCRSEAKELDKKTREFYVILPFLDFASLANMLINGLK